LGEIRNLEVREAMFRLLLGVFIGMLVAPKTGREFRQMIEGWVNEMQGKSPQDVTRHLSSTVQQGASAASNAMHQGAEQLDQFGRQAGDRIERSGGQFGEQTPDQYLRERAVGGQSVYGQPGSTSHAGETRTGTGSNYGQTSGSSYGQSGNSYGQTSGSSFPHTSGSSHGQSSGFSSGSTGSNPSHSTMPSSGSMGSTGQTMPSGMGPGSTGQTMPGSMGSGSMSTPSTTGRTPSQPSGTASMGVSGDLGRTASGMGGTGLKSDATTRGTESSKHDNKSDADKDRKTH